ncbi:hypothetical protein BU202_00490 [Streptococcus cuniculi]|uniref:G5 domain-containing protein n=1 Tax=Streptococcus cuniculi TaxID=1432788 RepID=A0A1Q8EAJ6_9STRE|nr:G5 domain-containing protein [Streptococcus cuniculi]OLF48803.1 hypothetical protein BU202_00490 [Streptococcus cuniculi]
MKKKATLEKTKRILSGIKQLPEVTDESLYKGQMDVWKEVGHLLDGYMQFFESLNPEKDANLTDAELDQRVSRLYDAVHYGEMEYIARDLEQKRKEYPDNQEMRELLNKMFYTTYATIETGGKNSDFVGFLRDDIYPKQKRFNELYRSLSSKPWTPLVPAKPIAKPSVPLTPLVPAQRIQKPETPETPEITTHQETREEAVPYQTITRENADLPKGEKRLVTKGEAGVRTVVEEVKMQGEELVFRTVISDTITKPAIDEVVEIGTKEVNKKVAKTPAPDKKGDGKTVAGKKGQQARGKNGRVLPRTNAVPSLLSFVGVALAGLTGLFAKNRKK